MTVIVKQIRWKRKSSIVAVSKSKNGSILSYIDDIELTVLTKDIMSPNYAEKNALLSSSGRHFLVAILRAKQSLPGEVSIACCESAWSSNIMLFELDYATLSLLFSENAIFVFTDA